MLSLIPHTGNRGRIPSSPALSGPPSPPSARIPPSLGPGNEVVLPCPTGSASVTPRGSMPSLSRHRNRHRGRAMLLGRRTGAGYLENQAHGFINWAGLRGAGFPCGARTGRLATRVATEGELLSTKTGEFREYQSGRQRLPLSRPNREAVVAYTRVASRRLDPAWPGRLPKWQGLAEAHGNTSYAHL
jgi:hypothetical protein